MAVKARYDISLTRVDDGAPGSKDVPYIFIQAATPTTPAPKKGDTWWVGADINTATAFRLYDGSKWVDQTIAQAVLNIKTLNAITVNGSTINGSKFVNAFSKIPLPNSTSDTGSGTLTVENGQVTINMTVDGDANKSGAKVIVAPSGEIRSSMMANGKETKSLSIFGGNLSAADVSTGNRVDLNYNGIAQPLYYWAGYSVPTTDRQHFTKADWCAQYTSLLNNMPTNFTVAADKSYVTVNREGMYRLTMQASVEGSTVWQGCEIAITSGSTTTYAARSYCVNNNSMSLVGISQLKKGDKVQYRKYSEGVCDLAYIRGSIERIF